MPRSLASSMPFSTVRVGMGVVRCWCGVQGCQRYREQQPRRIVIKECVQGLPGHAPLLGTRCGTWACSIGRTAHEGTHKRGTTTLLTPLSVPAAGWCPTRCMAHHAPKHQRPSCKLVLVTALARSAPRSRSSARRSNLSMAISSRGGSRYMERSS